MYQNLRLPILFVLLLLLPIYIQANTITSIQQQPDDAFCSSFSGINSTCSTCIEHGCIYCDSEGTGVGGTCISHNISKICPPKSSALITCPSTQLQQLQPSQQKQQSQQRTHSQYESNSIYLPIQLSVIILMITCYMGWKIQPSYAIPPTSNNESIPFKPVIVLTTQEGLDQPLLTSTLDAPVQPPTLTLTPQHHQQSGSPWEATLWYRLMLYLILVGLTCISIMSVILDSWSTIVTRDTIIVYGSSGDYTLSHDITLWSHYSCDQTSLQCRTHAIMMMITRILTISSASCLCLVMIHMSVSLLSHRSFSAYSFTMIYGACVSHILALVIFSTGPYLIQTSVNEPNIPQLSITWEMTLLAILINIIILLPMTWLHITNTAPPPSCWNPLSNVSLDDIVVDDMTCTSPSGTLCTCAACVGLGVSAPIEKMIVVTEYHTGKQD